MKRKYVNTIFGRLNTEYIEEYGVASDMFDEYGEDDLFILLKTPEESIDKYGFKMYVILHNFIPEDYNVYEKDMWSYGGLRSEGHYTVTQVDEDLTRSEYVSEYVDEYEIVYSLEYLKQTEYTIIATTQDELLV